MNKHFTDLEIMKREREKLASLLPVAPTSVDMPATIQRIGFLNVAIADAERMLNAAPYMVAALLSIANGQQPAKDIRMIARMALAEAGL